MHGKMTPPSVNDRDKGPDTACRDFSAEALQCREQAAAFEGRPEKKLLEQLAVAFDGLKVAEPWERTAEPDVGVPSYHRGNVTSDPASVQQVLVLLREALKIVDCEDLPGAIGARLDHLICDVQELQVS